MSIDTRLRSLQRAHTYSAPVVERTRFTRREARKAPGVAHYTLRRAERSAVILRHEGLDAWTLHEVFGLRAYALPGAIRSVLAHGRHAPSVLDLGANIGLFALFASLEMPRCSGTALEPDPESATILRRCLDVNELSDRWRVVEAAAATRDGTARFLDGHSAVSRLVEPDEPAVTSVEVATVDVLPLLATHDLVKLDIEGGEWQILLDPRFPDLDPRAMVIEFHSQGAPSAEPRAALVARLAACGYDIEDVPYGPTALPEGQGVLWAWRR